MSLIGHSAGATPAVWLGTGSQGDEVVKRDLPNVRSSVILDGPLNLAEFAAVDDQICGRHVIAPLMGGSPDQRPARYAMIDPLKNPPTVREMVIVVGALPPPSSGIVDGLKAHGITVTRIDTTPEQHFDFLKPGTPDFARIAPALLKATGGR